MFENPRRGRQARHFATTDSRSQIVFRTDIFRKLSFGCPWINLVPRAFPLTRLPLNKLPSVRIEAIPHIPSVELDYYLWWCIFFKSWQCFSVFSPDSPWFSLFFYVFPWFSLFSRVFLRFPLVSHVFSWFSLFSRVSLRFPLFPRVFLCFSMSFLDSPCFPVFFYVLPYFPMFFYVFPWLSLFPRVF